MLAGKSRATLRHKYIRKTTSTFRGKRETNRDYFTTRLFFSIFSKTSTRWYYYENAIILSFPNSTSWQNTEKLTWILPYSVAVRLKNGAIFVHFSTLRSVIFRIFIYALEYNSASVFLFKNLGNLKTNTTKILLLVLQNLSLLDSSFLGCFIREIATICTIPWFSTCDISKSSTRWYILLFIICFILPLPTQKCKFRKNDMDFGIVASTLKALLYSLPTRKWRYLWTPLTSSGNVKTYHLKYMYMYYLFRLGRKSGIMIGLDQSRGDRTWDYVRSVSFMYGSLHRRLWEEKNKMAVNVHVAMESSGYQFVLKLYYDQERHLWFSVTYILCETHLTTK